MNVTINVDRVTCIYVGDRNIQYVFEMPHTSSIAKRKKAAILALVDIGYADADEFNVLVKGVEENGVKYRIAFEDVQKYGTKI